MGTRSNAALSPDGTRLVYVARVDGVRRLVLRELDELEDSVLPGTEDAASAFFSPDGRWIGFTTHPDTQSGGQREGALKKVSVQGGNPITLHDSVSGVSAVWEEDDFILVLSPSRTEIFRVSSDGGPPELVVTLESTVDSLDELLPGGKAILAGGRSVSLLSGEVELLTAAQGRVRFVRTGHLLFTTGGTLMAAPFDPERVEITGAAVPMVEAIDLWAVSEDGSLVHRDAPNRQLVWVNRNGEEELVDAAPAPYQAVRVSPDGTKVALHHQRFHVENQDVWIYDLGRGTSTRLTVDPTVEFFPLWSPDGAKVVFTSFRGDASGLFSRAADASGDVELLLTSPNLDTDLYPLSWSSEGEGLVFEEENQGADSDIGMLLLGGDRTVRPILQEPFDQTNPSVSPDGRWIAYESNESGQLEVYVQRFPELGDKRQISNQGGAVPLWAPDGTELFYRNDDAVMAVTIGPPFEPSAPQILFTGGYLRWAGRAYDIHPSGERFLMVKLEETGNWHFVLNWFSELERLVPAGS